MKKISVILAAILIFAQGTPVLANITDYFVFNTTPLNTFIGRPDGNTLIFGAQFGDTMGHWAAEPLAHGMALGILPFAGANANLNAPVTFQEGLTIAVNLMGQGDGALQAGLDFIPKEYYECAALEGAGKMRQFFVITLPYLTPTFLLVFVLTVVNSFKVFREIYLLTGTHPNFSVYMLQHFINNQFANLNYQRMASASFFVFIIIFLLVTIFYRLQQKQDYSL